MSTRPCLDLEIGLATDTMLNLRNRGLPDPDLWTFSPYSRVEVGGDGRSRGFGHATASWSWNFLSQDQLYGLTNLFTNTDDASVEVYIYTYVDSGKGTSDDNTRHRYQCVMHRPVDGQGKTMINETRRPTYSDVTVNFTHLVLSELVGS